MAPQVDTISEQVARRHASAPSSPAMDALRAENARKVAVGLPVDVAAVGTRFPDGALLTALGASTTFAATAAGRPSVAIFYRGAWCPYCNIALRAYNETLAGPLAERGVALIAVSPQAPDGSLSMTEKNNLSFPVLSDPGNQIATELGILNPLTNEERAAQGSVGLDVTTFNADGTAIVTMPTACVIDTRGILRWIDPHVDFTTRSESADILAAVIRVLDA